MKVIPIAILSGLFCGPLGTFSAVWTMLFIMRGELLDAIVTLGVSAFFFGLITPFFKLIPGNIAPRSNFDDRGTTFRPDRGMDIPIHVALLGAVVACAMILVLFPQGKLDIPVPPFMRYSLPFSCAVLMAMGAPMLWRNLRRGSSKYLRLTPEGFEIAQEWRPQGGGWDQIVDVSDEAPDQTKSTPSTIAVIMSDGRTATMAAGGCTPDGTALREIVRFYWQHPDHRDELTDGRAIKRLADERFVA